MDSVFNQILAYDGKSNEDFYSVLGCDENSTEEQINTEYKCRVLSCHPDKHPNDPGAHERFSLLSKAKETLLDPEKRKDYDRWRHSNISIPYETWTSMAKVKTSMHWGVKKEQHALDQANAPPPSAHKPSTASQPTEEEKRISELKEKMKFTPRQTPPPSGWGRDTSNPLLQKFRNYEI